MQGRSSYLTLVLVMVFLFGLVSGASAMEYSEPPLLQERVAAGELPPIEERLPNNPFIVGPGNLMDEDEVDWEPGQSGGTLRTVHIGSDFCVQTFVMNNQALLVSPSIRTNWIQPDLLESAEVSDDNSTFTFRIREGLRWSDGVLVTTEDVRFAYEDVMLNTELTPNFPHRFRDPSGVPMELEILDEYTFQISFSEPYGHFLTVLAIQGWTGYQDLLRPAHYLYRYHINHTPLEDMQDDLAEEELDDDWAQLFLTRDASNWDTSREAAIGFPSLHPWIRVESPGGVIRMERNPYYHAVDINGTQLPYIDRIESHAVTDSQTAVMRVVAGEVDFLGQPLRLNQVPVLQERAADAGYEVRMLVQHGTPSVVYFNYAFEDPVWQEVTRDKRFRTAVNYAIDREQLNDSLYFGLAEPTSIIPSEFDPAEAERLLDEMGLDERDAEGYRIGPDGNAFEVPFEVGPRRPDIVPATEHIVEDLRAVGLKADMRQISNELRAIRAGANEIQATVEYATVPQWLEATNTGYLPPFFANAIAPWGIWYNTDGAEGQEPWPEVFELFDIHDEIMRTVPGTDERQAAIDALFAWYYEHYPYLITLDDVPQGLVVSDRLGNVAHSGFIIGAEFKARQFFIAE